MSIENYSKLSDEEILKDFVDFAILETYSVEGTYKPANTIEDISLNDDLTLQDAYALYDYCKNNPDKAITHFSSVNPLSDMLRINFRQAEALTALWFICSIRSDNPMKDAGYCISW